MCVGQGDRTLSPYMLVESSWLQLSRLRVCASLCSLCPVLHQQAENGLKNIWASHPTGVPSPSPTSKIPQQPFHTGKMSKKTHGGGPLNRMQCTVPLGRGARVMTFLGSSVVLRWALKSGGAIKGHRGDVVVLHDLA